MLLGDTTTAPKSQRGDNQRKGSISSGDLLWWEGWASGEEQETELKRKAKSSLRI